MDDLMERRQEELDQLTEAVATGYAIANSDKARARWQARHMTPQTADATAKQSGALARLSRYFPGAVKAKAN